MLLTSKELAAKDIEVTWEKVPVPSWNSKPLDKPPWLSTPQEKRPEDQVSFPVVTLQAERPEPNSWEEEE